MGHSLYLAAHNLLQNRQTILMGIPVMDNNRLIMLLSQFELPGKDILLRFAGRPVLVIIQPYLAHGHHLGALKQLSQLSPMGLCHLSGFMRMDTGRGVDMGILFGQCDSPARGIQISADGNDTADILLLGALKHGIQVILELGEIQMRVGVNYEHSKIVNRYR